MDPIKTVTDEKLARIYRLAARLMVLGWGGVFVSLVLTVWHDWRWLLTAVLFVPFGIVGAIGGVGVVEEVGRREAEPEGMP